MSKFRTSDVLMLLRANDEPQSNSREIIQRITRVETAGKVFLLFTSHKNKDNTVNNGLMSANCGLIHLTHTRTA